MPLSARARTLSLLAAAALAPAALAPGCGGTAAPPSTGSTAGFGRCESGTRASAFARNCTDDAPQICAAGTFSAVDGPNMPAVRLESEHFAARWNADAAREEDVRAGLDTLERIWRVYIAELGFPEPFCDSAEKHKVNVHIDPKFGLTGSGTGDRDPAMWIQPQGLRNVWGLAHELAHTLQYTTRGLRDSPYVGFMWESHAQWMTHQLPEHHGSLSGSGSTPRTDCASLRVDYPHLYYGSTRDRYCGWQFWEYVKDRFCYRAIHDIWRNAPESGDPRRRTADPFSQLAANLGLDAAGLNDLFGEWAMHNVTWDYRNPDGTDQAAVYRAQWGYDRVPLAADPPGARGRRLTRLEPLADGTRRFAVPPAWAPQRWGYNVVRLHSDAGARELRVTFRGVVQTAPAGTRFGPYRDLPDTLPPPDSDWRWGVVAVSADGSPRYSTLQRGTAAELCMGIAPGDRGLYLVVVGTPSELHQVRWDQPYFSLYRYPWRVELGGAWPDGFEPGAPDPTPDGARHPNGGGWVASRASVDPTAYVGPYAIVLGGRVTGRARIEDHAVVIDGTVSDDAVVGALTSVVGGVQIRGRARVFTTFRPIGSYDGGRQIIEGDAQLLGDVELRGRGATLEHGVYYGLVDAQTRGRRAHGSEQREPIPEVTALGPYPWNP